MAIELKRKRLFRARDPVNRATLEVGLILPPGEPPEDVLYISMRRGQESVDVDLSAPEAMTLVMGLLKGIFTYLKEVSHA